MLQSQPEEQPVETNKMSSSDAADNLNKLKELYDNGVITKEEYDEKRKKYVEML